MSERQHPPGEVAPDRVPPRLTQTGPPATPAALFLSLQRTVGNRAVAGLVQRIVRVSDEATGKERRLSLDADGELIAAAVKKHKLDQDAADELAAYVEDSTEHGLLDTVCQGFAQGEAHAADPADAPEEAEPESAHLAPERLNELAKWAWAVYQLKYNKDAPAAVRDEYLPRSEAALGGPSPAKVKALGSRSGGSKVWSIAQLEGQTTDPPLEVFSTMTSPTGYPSGVVEEWGKGLDPKIGAPSNPGSLPLAAPWAKNEPSSFVRSEKDKENPHAEVGAFRHQRLRSDKAHEKLPMTLATNMAHCVECWWAGHRIFAVADVKITMATGCKNKLFDRWDEPWKGFYKAFGDNPFRTSGGEVRKEFKPYVRKKEVPAALLNAAVEGKIYS